MKYPAKSGFALYSDSSNSYLGIDRTDPVNVVERFTRDPLEAFLWVSKERPLDYIVFAEAHWPSDLRVIELVINVERCAV